VTHCSHVGPGGAGHCGEIVDGAGNCESYCILAKAGCPTTYASRYGAGDAADAACQDECAEIPGVTDNHDLEGNETELYSVTVGETGGPDLEFQCRLLHTTRAIRQTGEPTAECDAVFAVAGSACPTP
jgi:hypothetical protein